jgi:hypothetical protein
MNSGAARRARTAYHRGGEVKTRLTIWLCPAPIAAQNSPFPRRILRASYPARRFKSAFPRRREAILSLPFATGSKGKRNAERRFVQPPHSSMRLRVKRTRPASGVPPRLSPRGNSFHPQSAARARFRERRRQTLRGFPTSIPPTSSGAPRVPVVVPADVMPEPPGEQAVSSCPQAPHPLHLKEYLRERRPKRARWSYVTISGTHVNRSETVISDPSCPHIAVRRTASLPLAYVRASTPFRLFRARQRRGGPGQARP